MFPFKSTLIPPNGEFYSLEDVIRFYVERDMRPEKWYPRKADGTVEMYDDLPSADDANVDVSDAPFDRHRGDEPALNDQEIEDVVAFLKTLTDGYQSANRVATSNPFTGHPSSKVIAPVR